MKYVLEPMALALDSEASEQEFKLYVNRLLQWHEWMERYPEDVYLLSDTCELLAFENFFPIYNVFDELVRKYQVNYVQAKDLNMCIQTLVKNAKKLDRKEADERASIEGDFCIDGVKTNLKKMEVGYPEPMWKALERTMRCIFCRCEMEGGKKDASFVLFGRNVSPEVCYEVVR